MGVLFEVAVNARPAAPVVFVVPDAIDDGERVSGGNVYDRRVRDGLRAVGWDVRMLLVSDDDGERLDAALSRLPDDTLVLVDGLLVARYADAIAAQGNRLRLIILAHMVAADLTECERRAYAVAQCIVATSDWTRSELIAGDAGDPRRIVVARPGTDAAIAATASASGSRLLCVGAVTPLKGHDLLVRALAACADVDGWTCTIAGSLSAAPGFVASLRASIAAAGIADRIAFTGVLSGRGLEEAYRHADLLVMPSRSESYGMAVSEALAHGVPVLASGVGGIPEAIGRSAAAAMIVPPEDPWALEVVLRQWWARPARRGELKAAALEARGDAPPWSTTTAIVASALAEVAATDGVPTGSASRA